MLGWFKNYVNGTPAISELPSEEIIEDSKRDTMSSFTDPNNMRSLLKRRPTMDSINNIHQYKQSERSFQYLQNILPPKMFNYYTKFLKSLKSKYKISLAKPAGERTTIDNNNIHEIFDMISPVDTPLLVYRCYRSGVNFNALTNQKNNTG